MTQTPPLWARTAMGLSQTAAGLGKTLVNLEEQALREEAMQRTGLEDWGDDDHREALSLFLESAQQDAALSLIGRSMVRTHTLNALTMRLQATDLIKQRPANLSRPPRRPIVIASFPRTGSTLAVNLLSAHPDAMSLPLWLALRPLPTPSAEEWSAGGFSERRAISEQTARMADAFMPNMKYIQPVTPTGRVECTYLLGSSFRCEKWWTNFPTRRYISWLMEAEMTGAYAYYRDLLQLIQGGLDGTFWALKAPGHVPWIRELLAVMPHALVVHLHRDPAACIPSLSSQLAMVHRLTSTQPDPEHIGEVLLDVFSRGSRRMVQAHRELGDDRILPIEYHDLVGDPIGHAERICRKAGVRWDDEVATTMQTWLDSRPRRPKHHYSPEDVGLTTAGIRAEFAEHIEYFGTVLGSETP